MAPEAVECYSGGSYAERPIAFDCQGRRHRVAEVEARRRSPGERWYRVRTEDGEVFELTYHEPEGTWQVVSP